MASSAQLWVLSIVLQSLIVSIHIGADTFNQLL